MKNLSILPQDPSHETALFIVVATICFIAALAGMIFKSTYDSADQWTSEVENQITVRILNSDQNDAESLITKVDGVISAREIERTELVGLLEPSIESDDVTSSLPVPSLFAVTTDVTVPDVAEAIETALLNRNYVASVTSHSARSESIRWSLNLLSTTSLAIIGLLTAGAVGIIIIATHSSVVSQRHVAKVLYLAGARDGFIMRVFVWRFCFNVFLASLFGALSALGVIFLLVHAVTSISNVEWWLPLLTPELDDLLIVGVTPFIASLVALVTARSTVLGSLKKLT